MREPDVKLRAVKISGLAFPVSRWLRKPMDARSLKATRAKCKEIATKMRELQTPSQPPPNGKNTNLGEEKDS